LTGHRGGGTKKKQRTGSLPDEKNKTNVNIKDLGRKNLETRKNPSQEFFS
jgi:hypothetical protein